MKMPSSNLKTELKIGISAGEPAGIGPDICIQSFEALNSIANVIYYADPEVLETRAELLGKFVPVNNLESSTFDSSMMNVFPKKTNEAVIAGQGNVKNSVYVIDCLRAALKDAISGQISGIVTAPVNKAIINEAGIDFSGHTEWLAQETNTKDVVMMLATENLRVALATTHMPLSRVSQAINPETLEQTIAIMQAELIKRFKISKPSILITGLNPHAGEMGYLGKEEQEVIIPVIEKLKMRGLDLKGPVPADTAFNKNTLRGIDAVLAMYHDQGLPVVKYAGFGSAVNITLGLPIIRTSVDHGTAYELAGTGMSDYRSMISAVECALKMAG